jgi:hypothetical protein
MGAPIFLDEDIFNIKDKQQLKLAMTNKSKEIMDEIIRLSS